MIQDLGNVVSEGLLPQVLHYQNFRDVQSSNDDLKGEVTADYFLLIEGIANLC